METPVIRYPLEPWVDLSEALGDSMLRSLRIGHNGAVYLLGIDPPLNCLKMLPAGRAFIRWVGVRPSLTAC